MKTDKSKVKFYCCSCGTELKVPEKEQNDVDQDEVYCTDCMNEYGELI